MQIMTHLLWSENGKVGFLDPFLTFLLLLPISQKVADIIWVTYSTYIYKVFYGQFASYEYFMGRISLLI